MLRALEALGLVKREVDMDDARQRLVMLTDEGAARIKAAHAEITEGGVAQRLLDYALGGPRRDREERAFWAMCELEEYLDAMRSAFRDRAWLYYPWHPDD
jgi:DNA-binding MarR family transcriptional regulator